MIRFLHAADLHLDSPFKGITDMPTERLMHLRESTFAAYENLIKYAEEIVPDFVLIVGDIYDGEDRSLRAQTRFVKGLERLRNVGIPVILSYGNHDHLGGKWTRFKLPDNVKVLGPTVETVELTVRGQLVQIHGFSYKERHVSDSMIDYYPTAISNTDTVHIGMLHGSIAGDESHDVYAPFTKETLLGKKYDYWALGHIHKRQVINKEPPVVYSGNLQGRHRNESGLKGFYVVELENHDSLLKFVSTSVLVFEELKVDCSNIQHANEWLAACQKLAEERLKEVGACIIRVRNVHIGVEASQLFSSTSTSEWLDVLRESANPSIWFSDILFESPVQRLIQLDSPLIRSVKDQIEQWNEEDWKYVLADVYQHARSAPYLEGLTDLSKEDIKQQSEKLLSNELMT